MRIDVKSNQMHDQQLRYIKEAFGQNVFGLFKETKCILAGGALTSMFSGVPVNDYDIYLPSEDALRVVLSYIFNVQEDYCTDDEYKADELKSFEALVCYITEKSVTLKINDNLVQLICFRYYDKPKDIFKSFDFTANMAAFEFATGTFAYYEDFVYHVAERVLTINPATDFPIISLLRLGKYRDRGWHTTRKGILLLGLACANLKIDTWEKLCSQLGGMYGEAVDKIFPTELPFTMESAISILEESQQSSTEVQKLDVSQEFLPLLDKLGLKEKAEEIRRSLQNKDK